MTSEAPSFVTVVSGLPRSGTSMMMQMLAAGGMTSLTDHVRPADDDNLRGYYEWEAIKKVKEDAGCLEDAAGKAVKVIYRLLYDLPATNRYRVLLMTRPLEEVVASQAVMLKRRNKRGADVPAGQLQQIFIKEIDRVRRWLAEQENFDVLEVPYAEAVANPHTQAERVRQFLDRPLDVAAMAAVVDRELYRQRK